jgi:hypothetical protein
MRGQKGSHLLLGSGKGDIQDSHFGDEILNVPNPVRLGFCINNLRSPHSILLRLRPDSP